MEQDDGHPRRKAGINDGDGEEKKAEVLRTPDNKTNGDGQDTDRRQSRWQQGRGKPRKWEDDLKQWNGEGMGQLNGKQWVERNGERMCLTGCTHGLLRLRRRRRSFYQWRFLKE